jgi:hypothetical protein
MWSVDTIVLSYGLEVPGLEYQQEQQKFLFYKRPDKLCGRPSLQVIGNRRVFTRVMWPEHVLTTQYCSIAEDTNQWN